MYELAVIEPQSSDRKQTIWNNIAEQVNSVRRNLISGEQAKEQICILRDMYRADECTFMQHADEVIIT